MMARVLLFAQAREVAARSEISWTISESQTAESLWEWLTAQYPAMAPMQRTCRVARNGEYLIAGELFAPDDEIAIIPPVSGG